MTLAAGTRLGPYEVLALLGAGGMGEVYKAKDTRLNRSVALKVLPEGLTSNPERRARFEHEARTISQLSHPHICALHDIGQQDGIDFLVMEFLEGETLASRLDKGALPIDQVLRYGTQIAEALDKAHRQGIIHRDLKPGNVMLTKSGAKLLDFGLAKWCEAKSGMAGASELLTRDLPLTGEGTVLGTVQYMSPEQLEGKELDARTDIFALGETLYEMATGRRAFTGTSKASLISAILSTEPPPIPSTQPLCPSALDRLVKKCLAKDPDDRWQSTHDVASELMWILEGSSQVLTAAAGLPLKRRQRLYSALAVFLFLTTLPFAILYFVPSHQQEANLLKVSVLLPENTILESMVISPDGKCLAFAGFDYEGNKSIWVRPLDSLTAQRLAGTEDAFWPFWSPDSRFIGFFAKGKLKIIAVAGGPPLALADAPWATGGTWNKDGRILFSPGGGLFSVSAAGGPTIPVTKPDLSHKEEDHYWPSFLPDGLHYLYVIISSQPEIGGVYLGSLDSKEKKRLLADQSNVCYAPPGYLLFVRDHNLVAQSFDITRFLLAGDPIALQEKIGYPIESKDYARFSVSGSNMLAYAGAYGHPNTQLTWFDRTGKQMHSIEPAAAYGDPWFSPDEKKVVLERFDPVRVLYDLWVLELNRSAFSRFTFGPGNSVGAVWSPDGSRIVFTSEPHGQQVLCEKQSNGTGGVKPLLESPYAKWADDWSWDGKYILYEEEDPATGVDLGVLPLFGDRKPMVYLKTKFTEWSAQFSPDGKWIAYTSSETGRMEVYIGRFPGAMEGKWQVSAEGGQQPRWRRDGKELFYIAADRKLMAVQINQDNTTKTGVPAPLFQTRTFPNLVGGYFWERNQYLATTDGQRFLVETLAAEQPTSLITVVLNWTAAMKR